MYVMSQPETTGDAYLSVIEVGSYLGCSRPHVYRLIETQALNAIDIAPPGSKRTKLRVLRSELDAFIASHRATAST